MLRVLKDGDVSNVLMSISFVTGWLDDVCSASGDVPWHNKASANVMWADLATLANFYSAALGQYNTCLLAFATIIINQLANYVIFF